MSESLFLRGGKSLRISGSVGTDEPVYGNFNKNYPDGRSQATCSDEDPAHVISDPRNDVASIQTLSWGQPGLSPAIGTIIACCRLTTVFKPDRPLPLTDPIMSWNPFKKYISPFSQHFSLIVDFYRRSIMIYSPFTLLLQIF